MTWSEKMLVEGKKITTVQDLIKYAKSQGVKMDNATAKYYIKKLQEKSKELSDDELDNVSGGVTSFNKEVSINPNETCPLWKCELCGSIFNTDENVYHKCFKSQNKIKKDCNHCAYCKYELGKWLCSNPINII